MQISLIRADETRAEESSEPCQFQDIVTSRKVLPDWHYCSQIYFSSHLDILEAIEHIRSPLHNLGRDRRKDQMPYTVNLRPSH